MALARDPFDFQFSDAAPRTAERPLVDIVPLPMSLPPIALCLPTLFGAAVFDVTATHPEVPNAPAVNDR